jgi:hypothetical protein
MAASNNDDVKTTRILHQLTTIRMQAQFYRGGAVNTPRSNDGGCGSRCFT